MRWSGAPLLALTLLAVACARPRGPAVGTPPPGPGGPGVTTVPTSRPQAPPSTDPFAPPDRTQAPWSQTPVRLLGIGEVETGTAAGGASWRFISVRHR